MIDIISVLIGCFISVISIWMANIISSRTTWKQKQFDLLVNAYEDVFSHYLLTDYGRNENEIRSFKIAIGKASLFVSEESRNLMNKLLIEVLQGYEHFPMQVEIEIQLRTLAKQEMCNCHSRKN